MKYIVRTFTKTGSYTYSVDAKDEGAAKRQSRKWLRDAGVTGSALKVIVLREDCLLVGGCS